MKVYRFMNEDELKMYFNGKCAEVGSVFSHYTEKRFNNFRYKKGMKYVHFFKRLKDVYRIKHEIFEQELKSKKRYFIGCFDIPRPLLSSCKGKGRYVIENENGGTSECYVQEYAIPSSKMEEEYLIYFKQEEYDDDLHWKVDEMEKEDQSWQREK
jgi:hypothetical protein